MPTPLERGYTFPPEWHPHAGTWMSWPRPEGISFPDRYDIIQPQLCGVVRTIAAFEPVHINVPDDAWATQVRALLRSHDVPLDDVHFHFIPTNEPWCRDHGPAFLVRSDESGVRSSDFGVRSSECGVRNEQSTPASSLRTPHSTFRTPDSSLRTPEPSALVVDWGFNAWGGKYPPWDDDDRVPTRVAQALGLEVVEPIGPDGRPVIMEGGAVDFNGRGTVLTTTDCLLNENRNPHLGKEQIEHYLKAYYGQKHVCWLTGGIEGDDTDGHVDDLARFVDERTIVVGVENDPGDANFQITQSALEQCRKLVDQDGQPFRVVELPMPGAVTIEGQRLPATYINFLFVNNGLIVPTYGPPERDEAALEVLKALCPGRQVVGVPCDELIWGLGAVHCLTQQMPAW